MERVYTSTTTRTTRYIVDGRQYASLDAMPADDRRKVEEQMKLLADADGSGVPDILESNADLGEVLEARLGGKLPAQLKAELSTAGAKQQASPGQVERRPVWPFAVIAVLLAIIAILLLR